MIERVIAYLILWSVGFIEYEIYSKEIDNLFLKEENSDLLLELEYCFNDSQKSISALNKYMHAGDIIYDCKKFGVVFFELLENIYESENMDINEFAKKAYKVWNLLPSDIAGEEPFRTLSYADDCLSYGDEMQTREFYKKSFKFYKKNDEFQFV
ncbi:hypothetical protein [Clostridium sp. UBA6640]|uniref:hypothetical protein n=1 Tax=Clostridium sp. UBA6640 TaxID=1946370 RepID=UPI0025C21FC0|nr:hypothetical protein [Clostridium sp. UBA6640]